MMKKILSISKNTVALGLLLFSFNTYSSEKAEITETVHRSFETMKVEELPMVGTAPEEGSSVIRRTWDDYKRGYPYHRIVLFSGHVGPHSGTFGTTQGPENYMIDQCWFEVKPDAVLDTKDQGHMSYIPDSEVDEIVADDSRFLGNQHIPFFHRMLKIGGKLVLRPGSGMGWPALDLFNGSLNISISDCGRFAAAPSDFVFNKFKDETVRKEFYGQALAKANQFYKDLGFSNVTFDETHCVFVLTK